MKPLANSPKQGEKSYRPVTPGPKALVAPAQAASQPRIHTQTRAPVSPNVRAQPAAAAAVQANRAATQPRGVVAQAGTTRSAAAVNQRTPNRPASPLKTPGYTVQAPVRVGGRGQQIRATIQGTPQVAGSVEISSAGPGKAYISNLTVDQQHRQRGVAGKLIDAAINTARRQGFSVASLEARPSDNGIAPQNLVAMYRRRGFKSVGKTGRGSPLMERKL
jgi:ribosomal protein S18 acetylase RimI-like enzyme